MTLYICIISVGRKARTTISSRFSTLKEGEQVKTESGAPNMDMEILAAEAKMKNAQNVMGPGGLGG